MTGRVPNLRNHSAQVLTYKPRPRGAALRIIESELEEFLARSTSATPQDAMVKAKYLVQLLGDTVGPGEHQRHALIAAVLAELDEFICAPSQP